MTGIVDTFIQTRNGRVHFLEAGNGPPLFLLHTLGGSAYQFAEALPLLAGNWRAMAWDMPGHGNSDPLTRHLTMGDYGDTLIDAMDQLGFDKAVVFGQSVGGYAAADLAARWGHRFSRALIGEAPPRVLEDYVAAWRTSEQTWTTVTNTMEEIKGRFRNPTPQLLARWNIDRNKAGAKAMMDTYWAIRDFDFIGALRSIEIPALLVLGEKNMAAQLEKYRAAGMKNFRYHIMKDCGHFLSIDDPEQLIKVIDDFAKGD